MINASISTGVSVLLDWIPAAGIAVLIPAFLIRRHRYRAEKRRLEQIIASYEAASERKMNQEENMPAK